MKLQDRILIRLDDIDYRQHSHSISKYSPENYSEDGRYLADEWTSFDDIGNVFNGVLLTESEYLKYEDKYINTIIEIASASGISYFTIGYAEKGNGDDQKLNLSPEMRGMLSKAAQGKRLNLSQTALYLRLLLREACWGVLVNERHRTQIEVGYDYYVNVHSKLSTETLSRIVHDNGLYFDRE